MEKLSKLRICDNPYHTKTHLAMSLDEKCLAVQKKHIKDKPIYDHFFRGAGCTVRPAGS